MSRIRQTIITSWCIEDKFLLKDYIHSLHNKMIRQKREGGRVPHHAKSIGEKREVPKYF